MGTRSYCKRGGLLLTAIFGCTLAGYGAVVVQPVPWIPATPTSPHTVITGVQATLGAAVNLGGSSDSFTYSWDFGDGSPVSSAALVTNTYDLSATHTYTAAAGTTYTAVLTVTDATTPASYTGNYYVVVQANTLTARVNMAVDNGLWYLHRTMWRETTTNSASQQVPWGGWDTNGGHNCSGAACSSAGGNTANNTQAFEVSGHLETGPATDPYTDDVARGLARTMSFLVPRANNFDGAKTINYNPAVQASRCSDGSVPNYSVNPPTCTAPATLVLYAQGATSCTTPPCTFTFDGNSDGQMIIAGNDNAGDPGYQAGMLLTAIVASGNPAGVSKTGTAGSAGLPGVYNQTYKNLVQDLVDGISYCQYYGDNNNPNGNDNGGGWEYYCAANSNDAYYYDDNSVSQWNAIALIAASRGFGLTIPPIVMDTNQVWTAWDENMTSIPGQFGYNGWNSLAWGPWATTPSGMVQLAMTGNGRTAAGVPDQRWNMAETYYHDNFCNSGGDATTSPKAYTYGLYSFTKAMEQHDPGGVLSSITYLLDMPSGTNPIDWYGGLASAGAPCDGVAQTLVGRQNADGSWSQVDYSGAQYPFETSWSVQMLQKTSFTACVTDLGGRGVAGPTASLTWSSVPGVNGYTVERSLTNGGPYSTVATTQGTTFTDSGGGLMGGTTYYYVVQPLNSDRRAVCTSNQASIALPAGGSGGLTVTGTDGGTIPLGSPIQLSVAATGATPPYSYSTSAVLPPGTQLIGTTLFGTPTQPGNYSIPVLVSDGSIPANKVTVTLTFSVLGLTSRVPAGITFSPYQASLSAAGGRLPYRYSLSFLPPGLNVNQTGTIQGIVQAPGTWTVTATVTEAGGVSYSAPVTFTFTAPAPLSVNSGVLPIGTVNTPYNAILGATGGAPPLTWAISSGALPHGLNLQPGGTIAGIPSTVGVFNFGVRATDLTGASAVGTASITVGPAPLTILTPSPLANGTVNYQYPALTFMAAGGIPPYSYAVTAGSLPKGLTLAPNGQLTGTPAAKSQNDYAFTVTVTDSAPPPAAMERASRSITRYATLSPRVATGSAPFTLTIRPPTTDLQVSSGSLTFALPVGSVALPPSQTVGVTSTGAAAINYSTSIAPAGTGWLSVGIGGSTPGVVSISLTNQALNLPASSNAYQASVLVTCMAPAPCAGQSQSVAVNLNVTATPAQLSVPTNLISFTTPASSPQAQSQGLVVQNTGGSSIGFASASCEAAWCTVTGVPGSVGAGSSVSLNVTADPTGLAAGFYRTAADLRTSAGAASVPVTLFIGTASTMTLQPGGTLFQSVGGGVPNGGVNSFLIAPVSSNPINWTASVLPGASWLSISGGSGTASAAQPGTVNFAIDPNIVAGLAPGGYYGTIRVMSGDVLNTPLDFQVVLNVSPDGANQTPAPSPAGLLFISAAGTNPPAQTVQLSSNSRAPIAYTAAASGGSWLSVSPASGNAPAQGRANSQISVNPANLNAGTYRGGVTYNFGGGSDVRTVNVTLIVPLASQAVQSDRPGEPAPRDTSATCTPTQIIPVPIGLVSNFSVPAGLPSPFSIQLMNNCGATVANGRVVSTFTNGDPAIILSLANPVTSLYASTWVPRQAAAQITVTTTASVPGFAPVTIQLSGTVTPSTVPQLTPNSTLNIYNPVSGAALAPGTLVQIGGSGLASAAATASVPLPTTLGGTQVVIGGVPAPLLFVSPTQLTAEIPFRLTPDMQYQVVVSTNGALSTPAPIQLSATDPGVATAVSGLVSASHANGSTISESSPAAPGETIVLVATGLGVTDNPVADGAASPASPLANAVAKPTVTINNEPAVVSFAGLQPGESGIYQINVQVPSDVPNGDLTLVLSQNGSPANSAVLPVKAGK